MEWNPKALRRCVSEPLLFLWPTRSLFRPWGVKGDSEKLLVHSWENRLHLWFRSLRSLVLSCCMTGILPPSPCFTLIPPFHIWWIQRRDRLPIILCTRDSPILYEDLGQLDVLFLKLNASWTLAPPESSSYPSLSSYWASGYWEPTTCPSGHECAEGKWRWVLMGVAGGTWTFFTLGPRNLFKNAVWPWCAVWSTRHRAVLHRDRKMCVKTSFSTFCELSGKLFICSTL